MVGGVGLLMASGEVEGVALAIPGLGITQPPRVSAIRVLSARRPMDARVISPASRPRGVMVLAKISDPILRPRRPRGTRNLPPPFRAGRGWGSPFPHG